jgi:hypothetical protein
MLYENRGIHKNTEETSAYMIMSGSLWEDSTLAYASKNKY